MNTEKHLNIIREGDKMSPLYYYTCAKCGKAYEIMVPLRKLDDEILCLHCQEALSRKMSAPMLIRVN